MRPTAPTRSESLKPTTWPESPRSCALLHGGTWVGRGPFIPRAGQKAPGFQRQPTEISDRSILRRGRTLHDLPANWLLGWIGSRVHVIYIVRSYAVELKNGFTLDAV